MPTKRPRLALVIDEYSKARIQHLAKAHNRSTSAEIVRAVLEWISKHPNEMQTLNQPEPTPAQQAQIDQLTQDAARAAYAQVMYFNNDSNTSSL